MEVEKDLPDIYVQRERMMQVFANLIDNAIKYMGEKENKKIIIGKTELQDEFVTLHVKDNGIGIKKEYLPLIFQLFTRIPNGLPNSVSGSGVGLANVKKIIETHGGVIWVESVYQKGTSVYISIPLKSKCQGYIYGQIL
jgi:signal transduction histidine kinase